MECLFIQPLDDSIPGQRPKVGGLLPSLEDEHYRPKILKGTFVEGMDTSKCVL
jgi:hypothetical protein